MKAGAWTERPDSIEMGDEGEGMSLSKADHSLNFDISATRKEYLPVGALSTQEGGDHYRKLKIQPIEYIHANGIPFAEGSAIKYLTRWRDKGGVQDLRKARHFIDLLIELETANG